jgi:hypothetical protein
LEERLARLEGGVEEFSKRIDDLKWFFYITWGVTWGLLIAMLSLSIRRPPILHGLPHALVQANFRRPTMPPSLNLLTQLKTPSSSYQQVRSLY